MPTVTHTRRRIRHHKQSTYDSPTIRSVYGEMILKKGTKLYHVSDDEFCPNPTKPMLFTVFHPSDVLDVALLTEHVTTITLKRDVSLFFMVSNIVRERILPLLDVLIGKTGQNLAKQSDSNLACYINHLKKDRFDGWFSTINGKGRVEVALINDTSIFEVASCEPFIRNWTNSNMVNNTFIPKRWGAQYEISPISLPITLNVNVRYKPMIEHYIAYTNEKYNNEFIFQILLRNARINYIDAPIAYINWMC
jgi:hypothetical protein